MRSAPYNCMTVFYCAATGYTGYCQDTTLAALLGRAENLQACAEHITEAALLADSQDNVTAVIVEIAGKM